MCDVCAMGKDAKVCDRPIHKVLKDGCGQNISYCKEAWEK